jgi:hypothetical protein
MASLLKLAEGWFSRVTLRDKPLPDPEPAFAHSRRVVGLRALLTPEQRARSLAYTGEESFGDVPPHGKAA